MRSEVFIYATGIATFLGLILQIRDAFPEHRNIRNAIFFMVLGIFIGSLLTTFRSVSVNMDFKITPYVVLIALAILAFIVILILAAFIKDATKSEKMFVFLNYALTVFCIVILLQMFSTCVQHGVPSLDITDDEIFVLVEKNIEKGNIGRAIELLEKVKDRVGRNDPRYSMIEKQINELKKKQMKRLSP